MMNKTINKTMFLELSPKKALAIVMMLLMLLWLSACSVTSSPAPVVQPEQSDNTALNDKEDPISYQACVYPPNEMVQACRVKGGDFLQQGMLGCYQCVLSYTDAGKVCQDSSDCQGQCKTTGEFIDNGAKNQSGQCASDSSPFGCYQTIEKGVAQPAICVD